MILKDINELFDADLRDPAYAAGYFNIALEEDGTMRHAHTEKSNLERFKFYREN